MKGLQTKGSLRINPKNVHNMKRTILLFILSVLISSTLQAQQTLPYHSYSDFNGNVAAYLKYNFEYRSKAYTGKTFAQMMNDMEIQPLGYIAVFQFPSNINPSILLYFKAERKDKFHELRDDYITIIWETTISSESVIGLTKQYPDTMWVAQHYDFFKDKIIKRILFNPSKEITTPFDTEMPLIK